MTLLCLVVTCLTLSGPRIERISPPGGGTSWWRNDDLSFIVGEANKWDSSGRYVDEHVWLWTRQTGTLRLDQIVSCPTGVRVLTVSWTETEYRLLLRECPPMDGDNWYMAEYIEYVVSLPKDPRDWFPPGDFDNDGDVDQTDFGLLQRALGGHDNAFDLTRDGRVSVADIDKFKNLLTGQ